MTVFCNTHYSYECECPIPVAQVRQAPAYVWVVVEVYSKMVKISNGAATGQISGKASIFAKPEVTQQVAARTIGVYASRKLAEAAVDMHRVDGAEYTVGQFEVEDGYVEQQAVTKIPQQCARCYGPAVSTFCDACQMERNRIMRERDGDIIADQQPVIKSTFAFRDPLPTNA